MLKFQRIKFQICVSQLDAEVTHLCKLISSWAQGHWNGIWDDLTHLVILSVYGSIYSDVKDYETKNKMHLVMVSQIIPTRENGSLDFNASQPSLAADKIWVSKYIVCYNAQNILCTVHLHLHTVFWSVKLLPYFWEHLTYKFCSFFRQIWGVRIIHRRLVVWKLEYFAVEVGLWGLEGQAENGRGNGLHGLE